MKNFFRFNAPLMRTILDHVVVLIDRIGLVFNNYEKYL